MATALSAAIPAAMQAGEWAWKNREGIASGAKTGIRLAKKYSKVLKPLANTLMHVRGRRKAASTIMNKLKNPLKSAKELSGYIKSGKALKVAKGLASDAHEALNAAEQVSGKDFSTHKALVSGTHDKFQHYHDLASKYNDQARESVKSIM